MSEATGNVKRLRRRFLALSARIKLWIGQWLHQARHKFFGEYGGIQDIHRFWHHSGFKNI
jgi:hypothetical protein